MEIFHYIIVRRIGTLIDSIPILNEDLHTFNKKGLSPIHVAIKSKSMEAAETLLKRHNQLCKEKLGRCKVGEDIFDMLLAAIHDYLSKRLYHNENFYTKQLNVSLRILLKKASFFHVHIKLNKY